MAEIHDYTDEVDVEFLSRKYSGPPPREGDLILQVRKFYGRPYEIGVHKIQKDAMHYTYKTYRIEKRENGELWYLPREKFGGDCRAQGPQIYDGDAVSPRISIYSSKTASFV